MTVSAPNELRTSRMLLVCFPMLSSVWRDGTFLLSFDLAEELVDSWQHHVYLLLPGKFRASYEERYPPSAPRPGITPVYDDTVGQYRFKDRFRLLSSSLLLENFSRRYGKYHVDWVFTTEPEPAPAIYATVSDTANADVLPVPIFMLELGTFIPIDLAASRPLRYEAVGLHRGFAYTVGHPVYFTQTEQERAESTYARWLSPAALRIMRQRTVIRPTMLSGRLDAFLGAPKGEGFEIFFGGRISPGKKPKRIAHILTQVVAQAGEHATARICASNKSLASGDSRELTKRFTRSITLEGDRETFWRQSAAAHVGLCTSEFENFGLGFLEMLYLGTPVLMPQFEWAKTMYPSWYPWFYKNDTDAIGLALRVKAAYTNGTLAPDMARVREWVIDFVGRHASMQRFMESVDHARASVIDGVPGSDTSDNLPRDYHTYVPLSKPVRELLGRAVMYAAGRRVSLAVVNRIMSRLGENWSADQFQRAIEPRLPSDYDVYRTLRDEWGLVDDPKSALPSFQIPAGFTPPST